MSETRRAIPRFLARFLALLATLAVAAAPAFAGIHYQAMTSQEGARGTNDIKVEGWVSGDKGRVEFKQSDNPATKTGTYLITKDGGKTLYLVNPDDKTYALWDVNAMLGFVGGMMNGMGPLLKMEFSDPKVEKLGEDDGGMILGYPTRHYKFRTSYSTKVRVIGIGRSSDTVTEQEIWATTQLHDPALRVWLRHDPPRTGNEQFDKLIAAETEKQRLSGFPLKQVATTTTTQRGQERVFHRTMEVTLLETKSIPDSSFEIPAGYKEVQMETPQGKEKGGDR